MAGNPEQLGIQGLGRGLDSHKLGALEVLAALRVYVHLRGI